MVINVEPVLKPQDLGTIQRFGRLYMQSVPGLRAQILREAADFISIGTDEERERLYIWWEEGVRNTAESQNQVHDAMFAIRDQVAFNELYKS